MPEYELTALAEKDLKSIARYTIDKWGLQQAKRYETLLANRFQQIAHGRITPRVFFDHRQDLLFTRCEHHYIFYCTRDNQCPLILAVFHERMDLMQRLKNCLA
jgi:plasmid stabilization system protein ParE